MGNEVLRYYLESLLYAVHKTGSHLADLAVACQSSQPPNEFSPVISIPFGKEDAHDAKHSVE